MGYYMTQDDSHFGIKAADKEKALEALKVLATQKEKMGGGTWQGGREVSRHFGFVDMSYVNESDLASAMLKWRWELDIDPDTGDVIGIAFIGEKLADDSVMLEALAPFVEEDSFIVMHGEDGAIWRWYFLGGKLLEQTGQISFG